MKKNLIVSLSLAASLYFIYPVLLGYCSIPVSGFFAPGLLAALSIFPIGVLYGFVIRGSKYVVLLNILPILPMLLFLMEVSSQPELFWKSLFDVLIAVASFTVSAGMVSWWFTRHPQL